MLEKQCARCHLAFTTYRDTIKYCSPSCAMKAIAAKNPQCQPSVAHTVEMFLEAEEKAPLGASRAQYIADTFGGTPHTVLKSRRRLKYIWKRRPRPAFDRKCAWFFKKFVIGIGCAICEEQRATEAAHYIALSKKGVDTLDNIIPLCPTHHTLLDRELLSEQEITKLKVFMSGPWQKLQEGFENAKSSNFGKPKKGRKLTISDRRYNQINRKQTLLTLLEKMPEDKAIEAIWCENSREAIELEIAKLQRAEDEYTPRGPYRSATIPTS